MTSNQLEPLPRLRSPRHGGSGCRKRRLATENAAEAEPEAENAPTPHTPACPQTRSVTAAAQLSPPAPIAPPPARRRQSPSSA